MIVSDVFAKRHFAPNLHNTTRAITFIEIQNPRFYSLPSILITREGQNKDVLLALTDDTQISS